MYKEELAECIPVINKLLEEKEITVNGISYTLDPYLVVDMKTLCVLLGLYDVFRSNTTFKCCWCLVTDNEIYDMKIKSHPFRKIQDMITAAGEKTMNPTNNGGTKVLMILSGFNIT